MRRTITAVLLAATSLLGLTACTSSTPAPAKTATASPSPSATSRADAIQACVDAIASGADEGDGAPECTGLPLDDYYEALHRANQAGRDGVSPTP
jgi:hypothetical protein